MGQVFADITLQNATDFGAAGRGYIKAKDIRQTMVRAMVDTGAGTLVINEAVYAALGLKTERHHSATFANSTREICKVTEPVRITWKDRISTCHAFVVSGGGEVLLGAIPLEDMDLIVNPGKQELVGAHGDEVMCNIK
jgi:clan AA aspartic protease